MPESEEAFLSVRDLHVSYGPVTALRGVTIEVAVGEAVAILGRNGVGKTTTLRAIAGLVDPRPGEVRFEDADLDGLRPEHRIRRGIVLVPEGRSVFPDLDVAENLRMGSYHRRLPRRRHEAEVARVLDLFPELAARRHQHAGSLSGGEQQMLVTARALLAEPRLLLMDEPSLGLAPIAVDRLYEIFTQLRQAGIALVIVEQYVDLALQFTDRAYVLDRGIVAMQGASNDLASSHELIEAYLATVPNDGGVT